MPNGLKEGRIKKASLGQNCLTLIKNNPQTESVFAGFGMKAKFLYNEQIRQK
ncbi:hypothetical protein IM774_04370 [Erysipelotrichaceae bacterium RD49]|nr:hypothetical protein [Erysipelotrichaceae bacterium RD49]